MMEFTKVACPNCGNTDTLTVFRVHAHSIKRMCAWEGGKLYVELDDEASKVNVSESDYMYPGGEHWVVDDDGSILWKDSGNIEITPHSHIPYAAVFCSSCSLGNEWTLQDVFEYNIQRIQRNCRKNNDELVWLLDKVSEHLLEIWQKCDQTMGEHGPVNSVEQGWAFSVMDAQVIIKGLKAKIQGGSK